ncbi:MAG TPA: CRTAC1 family protein, partial [Bryobacteraceae bacterium]|nr:CRTAC1 family protein [Bryobacteraceae bacterium]
TGPGPQFIDQTAAAGLALETAQMSGWSNAIVDLDADGWKDLFVARSNVIDNIGVFSARKYHEPNSIFRNLGAGRFENVSAAAGPAFHKPEAHRGAAFGDLDNDGRIDLVVSVLNGRARVFRNTTTPGNHWLMLNLRGTKSNRQGVGASIRLTTPDGKTQYNHATTSTGYASSSDPRVYFGLGAATSAKTIEVRWPSGTRQVLRDVASNQILATTEP